MPWCAPIGSLHTFALARVCGGQVERQPAGAARDRRAHDPLRVEPVEERPSGRRSRRRSGARPGPRRRRRRASTACRARAARSGCAASRVPARRRPRSAAAAARDCRPSSRGAGHDQDRVRILDARDERLLRRAARSVAVRAPRGGREVVRVGAGVGLGDGERDLGRAGGDARAASVPSAPRCRAWRGCCRRSPATPRSGAASSPRPRSPPRPPPAPDMPSPPPPYCSGRLTPR